MLFSEDRVRCIRLPVLQLAMHIHIQPTAAMNFQLIQDSPHAWTQDAYLPSCSKEGG